MIRTIARARANFALTMMAPCYNPKRLVCLCKAGIEAFRCLLWAESPFAEAWVSQ
jgi:hypothetical protein